MFRLRKRVKALELERKQREHRNFASLARELLLCFVLCFMLSGCASFSVDPATGRTTWNSWFKDINIGKLDATTPNGASLHIDNTTSNVAPIVREAIAGAIEAAKVGASLAK